MNGGGWCSGLHWLRSGTGRVTVLCHLGYALRWLSVNWWPLLNGRSSATVLWWLLLVGWHGTAHGLLLWGLILSLALLKKKIMIS